MKLPLIAAAAAALCLSLASTSAFAAGGVVIPRTNGGGVADGYYIGLGGSGSDRFINLYGIGAAGPPGTILCGMRVREVTQGQPPFGVMGGEIRAEDAANPGYPDLVAPPLAVVDAASTGACSTSAAVPRVFTFGNGAGIPLPNANHFACAIEPVHGPGPLDFCGMLLDTQPPALGFARLYSGGVLSLLPFNLFVEEITFTPTPMAVATRATGSARYPGDAGRPVVVTRRPNATGAVTDDNLTLTIAIDNGAAGPLQRSLDVCADSAAFPPRAGLVAITPLFTTVGGGIAIMNPITVPPGRTVLRLEVAAPAFKARMAAIVDRRTANLPLTTIVEDPAVDVFPCVLEGTVAVGAAASTVGLRRRAGSVDRDVATAYFVVQSPSVAGDALDVRFRAIDMPRVAFTVTGLEIVGGEFGASGLPGLDNVELRTDDPIFAGSPDLSGAGLLRSFAVTDGIGSVPLGPAPTTRALDVEDLAIAASGARDLHVMALLLPGESGPTTAIAADQAALPTILGDSTFCVSGVLPTRPFLVNWMLRLLLDGDRATLEGARDGATASEGATLREVGRMIAIDRWGRRIE